MNKARWFVITGGPSTGKSTLLKRLEEKGFKVIEEAAHNIIEEELQKGYTLEEIRKDEIAFQHKVHERKLQNEKNNDHQITTFLDRGLHDTKAYLEAYGHKVNSEIEKILNETKYGKVFILQPLEFFEKNHTRTESMDFTLKINELLKKVYASSGHTVIEVPILSPADRADFVLQHID